MPLLLTEADVRRVLSMRDLIETMEGALAQFSSGTVAQPLRTVLEVGPARGYFGVMPASVPEPPAAGAKLVTLFAGNTARGLPTHLATIVLIDPETGALLAVMDGRYITEARTAAVSAVSVRHLANPGRTRMAVLGSGVQARSHVEAIPLVADVEDIRVWSPTPANRERLVAEMAPHARVPLRAVTTAEEAARDAGIIVLVTSATEPVLRDEWVRSGAHVISVGACRPDQRETDPRLVARARLFVDSRVGALAEAGDIVLGIRERRFAADHIAAELGEVVARRAPGRTSAGEITLFKSLGMAVEDVAAAHLAYRRAGERGLGQQISLEGTSATAALS